MEKEVELKLKKIDGKICMGLNDELVSIEPEKYNEIIYIFLKEVFDEKKGEKPKSLQFNKEFIITDIREVTPNEE